MTRLAWIVEIDHLYIERRMLPLNLYLDQAADERIERVVRDYGDAIRGLLKPSIAAVS